MHGYANAPTRARTQGAEDKAALMEAMAAKYADDRDFSEFVMSKLADTGDGADKLVEAWAEFCESLPYRREPGEVYRDPMRVVQSGGDCDDLTIVFVAGCLAVGVPAKVEILTNEEGWGFHVRARVGLPPHAPEVWAVVDPVWRSEKQWAMANRDPTETSLTPSSSSKAEARAWKPTPPPPPRRNWLWLGLCGLAAWKGLRG